MIGTNYLTVIVSHIVFTTEGVNEHSLRARSPMWASEAIFARTCERAAKPRGAEDRKGRRACSRAKMTILSITLQVTPPMAPGRVATFQWNITGFEEQSNSVGRAVGIKSPLFAGQFRAQDITRLGGFPPPGRGQEQLFRREWNPYYSNKLPVIYLSRMGYILV